MSINKSNSNNNIPSPSSVTRELDALRKENEQLKQRLQGLFHLEEKGGMQQEVDEIRAVFDLFDADKSGFLDAKEIKSIHERLGEPLTEAESEEAIKTLDTNNDNKVSFEEFYEFWHSRHVGETKNNAYRQRFKMVNTKLHAKFDLNSLSTEEKGEFGTLDYRLFYKYREENGNTITISPWHDIPLHVVEEANVFHFVCEIPKWTRAKMEIATGEVLNPIKQDVKNGKLRNYQWGDMCFNYGCLPQTWESPHHIPKDTGAIGDNDPIDVLELGVRQCKRGEVMKVKVLGVLALIDDGQTDWKLIVISINDPMAKLLNSVEDVEKHIPGAIHAIREYLRVYKVVTGKPANTYALDERCMPQDYALKVIEETHQFWKELRMQNQTTVPPI